MSTENSNQQVLVVQLDFALEKSSHNVLIDLDEPLRVSERQLAQPLLRNRDITNFLTNHMERFNPEGRAHREPVLETFGQVACHFSELLVDVVESRYLFPAVLHFVVLQHERL